MFYFSRSNCHQAVDRSRSRFGIIRTQYLIFDDYILYQIFPNCRLVILPLSEPIQISVRRLSAECSTVRSLSDCRDSDCQDSVLLSEDSLTVRRQSYCQDSVLLSEDSVTISVRTGNVGLDVGVGFVYSCRLCKQIWIGQDQTRVIIVILNSTKSVQSSQVRKVERLLTTVRVRLEII